MRGETDTAPLLLCLMKKGNNDNKETEASYGDRTNIEVVFDASPPVLSVHTKTTGEN